MASRSFDLMRIVDVNANKEAIAAATAEAEAEEIDGIEIIEMWKVEYQWKMPLRLI